MVTWLCITRKDIKGSRVIILYNIFTTYWSYRLYMAFVLWQLLVQWPIAALISKSQEWISSREHKLCNSQANLTKNYNSILPTIYIKFSWSVLQLCIYCASYPQVHVSSMSVLCVHHVVAMLHPHIHYSSTLRLAYCIYVLWYYLLDSSQSF